jgi:hypothetical protein
MYQNLYLLSSGSFLSSPLIKELLDIFGHNGVMSDEKIII